VQGNEDNFDRLASFVAKKVRPADGK